MASFISREELKEKMDRGDHFILIEALSPMSYQNGHLPGAINLPTSQVAERAHGLIPDKTADIVIYCGSST